MSEGDIADVLACNIDVGAVLSAHDEALAVFLGADVGSRGVEVGAYYYGESSEVALLETFVHSLEYIPETFLLRKVRRVVGGAQERHFHIRWDSILGHGRQKEELRRAEHFIFMEYHAIEDAESWHAIQDILEERVRAGVEVRVFYDDAGSIGFVNTDFVDRLEAKGIKAKVFNPFMPGINLFLNNRDHRKITVIDGKVGFTGGYNIANEYFNLTHPYGHWKDTGVRLEGPAVKNLTAAFLEMWNASDERGSDDKSYEQYFPEVPASLDAQGYVQPYADSPMDDVQVGEDTYISAAEYAQKYVWFVTPYLIITDEMERVLGLAARRGVDVRIITPGIPDKKIVYSITRSYYHKLALCGVRIFEYTPGFVHAKMCVADDVLATCGTINLDYRSLYHHFENGCLYYDCDAVADTKADCEWMFAQSREVTKEYIDPAIHLRLWHLILRLAAPLL